MSYIKPFVEILKCSIVSFEDHNLPQKYFLSDVRDSSIFNTLLKTLVYSELITIIDIKMPSSREVIFNQFKNIPVICFIPSFRSLWLYNALENKPRDKIIFNILKRCKTNHIFDVSLLPKSCDEQTKELARPYINI